MDRIAAAAKGLAFALLAALLVLCLLSLFLWGGLFRVGVFWLILLSFWQWLPAAAAAACVRASPGAVWAGFFLVVEAVFLVWALGLWIDSLLPRSHLPPVEYVFNLYLFPAVQLAILAVLVGLAFAFGWRAREGWRNA